MKRRTTLDLTDEEWRQLRVAGAELGLAGDIDGQAATLLVRAMLRHRARVEDEIHELALELRVARQAEYARRAATFRERRLSRDSGSLANLDGRQATQADQAADPSPGNLDGKQARQATQARQAQPTENTGGAAQPAGAPAPLHDPYPPSPQGKDTDQIPLSPGGGASSSREEITGEIKTYRGREITQRARSNGRANGDGPTTLAMLIGDIAGQDTDTPQGAREAPQSAPAPLPATTPAPPYRNGASTGKAAASGAVSSPSGQASGPPVAGLEIPRVPSSEPEHGHFPHPRSAPFRDLWRFVERWAGEIPVRWRVSALWCYPLELVREVAKHGEELRQKDGRRRGLPWLLSVVRSRFADSGGRLLDEGAARAVLEHNRARSRDYFGRPL